MLPGRMTGISSKPGFRNARKAIKIFKDPLSIVRIFRMKPADTRRNSFRKMKIKPTVAGKELVSFHH